MKKILCVTLDAEVRRELEIISEPPICFEVTFASSVSEIVVWTGSVRFDVFVLDARILGEGSSHLYSTVRDLDGHGLVICLSPSDEDRDKECARAADIFLRIPDQITEIRPVISEFIDRVPE